MNILLDYSAPFRSVRLSGLCDSFDVRDSFEL
jgi:hypothetical protein